MATKFFKRLVLVFFLLSVLRTPYSVASDDEKPELSTLPRQVGGLLFDYDEGVDIEQGPGGSVYVKSNRDYIQKKFREIAERFDEMEARLTVLEESTGILPKTDKTAEGHVEAVQPRVLST